MKTKFCVRVLFIILFILVFDIKNGFALQITKVSGPKTSPWVEFYNDSEDIKIIEGISLITNNSVKPSKHGVKIVDGRSSTFSIPSKTYFIIAQNPDKKFFDDVSCPIFSSSFNFVIGEVLSYDNLEYLIDNVDALDSTSCSTGNPNTNTSSTSSSSTTLTTSEVIKYIYIPLNNQNIYGDIKVLLPEERIIPAAAESEYTLKAIDGNGRVIAPLDFHWSFGDGGEKFGKDVSYTYIYPGEYTLIATADGYTSGGQARMNVKVINPDLKIVRVGAGEKDNIIDIENKTDYDLFLSGFKLRVDGKNYILSKNLLIAKNKIVHLSGEALGFKLPATSISLLYPNENILTSYAYEYNSATNTSTTLATNTLNILNASSENIINPIPQISPVNEIIINSVNQKISKNIQSPLENKEKVNNPNQDEGINSKIIKRLILESDVKSVQNYKSSNKVLAKSDKILENNDKNVDTGIINWLKSLIY